MLAALLLNIGGQAPETQQKRGIAYWGPRVYRRNFHDEVAQDEVEAIVDELPVKVAQKVEKAIKRAIQSPEKVMDYSRIWESAVTHASVAVQKAIREILVEQRLEKEKLKALFLEHVERKRQEEEDEVILLLMA